MERNNGELVAAYGNFVNRTLAFIEKYFGGLLPRGSLDLETKERIEKAYGAGEKIEEGRFKEALECIFELVRYGNKYFDIQQPWKTRTEAPEACANALFVCVQIICNLAVLLSPFLPFSSGKLFSWLGIKSAWRPQYADGGRCISGTSILFERIDKKVIGEELSRIGIRK